MNAVPLQIPGLEASEIVIARDQPEYIPLPALPLDFPVEGGTAFGVLTRWRLTDEEREAISNGADLWVSLITFGQPMQPIRIETTCPVSQEPQG